TYYANEGEIWKPSHAFIEIAPAAEVTEENKVIILNPFNSYRSINLGPSKSGKVDYLSIATKGDEEVRNWFQTLIMTDDSGFSARITNLSDGVINTVLGGMAVEVIKK